jgi:hypothetical protein
VLHLAIVCSLALLASCSVAPAKVNTKQDVDRDRDAGESQKRGPEPDPRATPQDDDGPSPSEGSGTVEPEARDASAFGTPVLPAATPMPPTDLPQAPDGGRVVPSDGGGPDPAEPRTDAGTLADASAAVPQDAAAPTLADGLRCASTQCAAREVCVDCDQLGDAVYPTCVPHPKREPERFAAATELCPLVWLWGECDGVEDCAPGQYCVTKNVSDSDYRWGHCALLDEALLDECEADCLVCNDDADCPSDQHCGGELSLQSQFSTCEPD